MKFSRVEVYVYRTKNKIPKDVLHNIWEEVDVVFDQVRRPSMVVKKDGKILGEFLWTGEFFDITDKEIVFESMCFYGGLPYDEFCTIKLKGEMK